MKIAFILPEISGGGIATYYRNLIKGMIDDGHEITTIVANYNINSSSNFPGTLLTILESDYKEGKEKNQVFDVFPGVQHKAALSYACYKIVKELDVDVIELTDYNLLFYHFLLEKKWPTVIRLAGSSGQLELHEKRENDKLENAYLLMLEQTLLNKADYIISLSKSNKDFWQQLLNKPINYHLPYLSYPDVLTNRSKINLNGVVLGRLQLWKGAKFLCDYYNQYPNSPDVEWIGGDNYYLDYKQSMAGYLSKQYPSVWNKKINFSGRKNYADAQKAISQSGFVLVPSTWDTFNFVVTEAMWQGKIVIAASGAGASELIEHGKNGFVFESNNAQSLHQCFEDFKEKSELELKIICENAIKSVRDILNNKQLITERSQIFQMLKNKQNHLEEHILLNQLSGKSTLEAIIQKMSIKDYVTNTIQKIKKRF